MSNAEFPSTPARASMPDWYPKLLDDVSGHIIRGRLRVIRAANAELLASYWAIGREILDQQEAEGWGAKVVDRLSADLRERFPDARGFSPRNLKYMRAFAAAWPDRAFVQQAAAQIPWATIRCCSTSWTTLTGEPGTRLLRPRMAGVEVSWPSRSRAVSTNVPVGRHPTSL